MGTYTGSCHCGDITIEYHTDLEPAEWPLRECQCSFCLKHAMLSTSDPNGDVLLMIGSSGSLNRYRFAMGVTDFLICKRCGVYIAATVLSDTLIVLNGRMMDCSA